MDIPAPALPTGNWLHLHTLTIESKVKPPTPTRRHHQHGEIAFDRSATDKYNQLADQLRDDRDPSIPLTVAPPSFSLLQIAKVPKGYEPHFKQSPYYIGLARPAANGKSADVDYLSAIGSYEKPTLARYGYYRSASIPQLRLGACDQWFANSDAFDARTWLHAVLAMDPKGLATRKGAPLQDGLERFKLVSSAALTSEDLENPLYEGGNFITDTQITMTVTVDVHANLDNIVKGGSDLINEWTGYILHSLMPAKVAAYASEADARVAGLRDFFACLRPAPPLPLGTRPNDLQPTAMRSRLLPFQQRTVCKLIEREKEGEEHIQAGVDKGGDPIGTWSRMNGVDGTDRYAYRRATGTVVKLVGSAKAGPTRKGKEKAIAKDEEEDEDGLTAEDRASLQSAIDPSRVRGTMLCEEMGMSLHVFLLVISYRTLTGRSRQDCRSHRSHPLAPPPPLHRR